MKRLYHELVLHLLLLRMELLDEKILTETVCPPLLAGVITVDPYYLKLSFKRYSPEESRACLLEKKEKLGKRIDRRVLLIFLS